jgi:hypothetical protein
MSGPVSVTTPFTVSASASLSFACLTGFVRRRTGLDIFQRGTHLLVDASGRVIAVLRSSQVNLFALEGRFVTVCGVNEGQIEGVTSLLVTQVIGANVPGTTLPPQQIDLRTLLLLLLLTNPNLLQGFGQNFLLSQLLSSGTLGGATATVAGTGTSGATITGI